MRVSVTFKDGTNRMINGVRLTSIYPHKTGKASNACLVIHFHQIGQRTEWVDLPAVHMITIHEDEKAG